MSPIFSGQNFIRNDHYLDINQSSLLHAILFNSQVNVSELSFFQASMIGYADQPTRILWGAQAGKEYMIPFLPQNTCLRRDGLLNLEMCSTINCEFWTLPASEFLYSANGDATTTYTMSNIEMHCQYIFSPSWYAWSLSNSINFSCTDYTQIIQNISDQSSQIRVTSSRTSLNGVLLVMRNTNVDALVTTQDKYSVWNSNGLTTLNALVNQQKFFDQDISSYNELFRELSHLLPRVKEATFFTSAYTPPRFLLGIEFASAPQMFDNEFTSGIKTSNLQGDIVLQMNFAQPLTTLQQVNMFLESDVVIMQTPEFARFKSSAVKKKKNLCHTIKKNSKKKKIYKTKCLLLR